MSSIYENQCFLFDHLNRIVENELPIDIHIVMKDMNMSMRDRMKNLTKGIELLSIVLKKRANN